MSVCVAVRARTFACWQRAAPVLRPSSLASTHASPQAEHQVSKDFSAFLNSAYQTLKLPAKRAEYMLNRRGIALEDASLDQNFLVEMMELRSDIEELAGDAGTAEQLRALQATVDDAMRQDSAALTAALAAHNDNEAKTRTLRLRYWQRAATAIDDALP